jgi:hypothetical protein
MTFEQWWESLSESEKKFLGIHNARYCWLEGHKHGYSNGYKDAKDIITGEVDANN